ncbi:MAG: hypothetical protein ATN35_04950 [Epulopiscium sp. Nele67-Bin004]|nr:MAG: hypothetical protein ATN35_04950 [Epulopiscium sp. Nele67-Bin004]
MIKKHILLKINDNSYQIVVSKFLLGRQKILYNKFYGTNKIESLQEMLHEINEIYPVNKSKVSIYLELSMLTYKITKVHATSKSHLHNLLVYKSKDYIDLDSYIIDYKILSRDKLLGTYNVALVGAPLEISRKLLQTIKEFGYNVDFIVSEGEKFANICNNKLNEILIGVYIQKDITKMFAIQNKSVIYNRIFEEELTDLKILHFIKAVEHCTDKRIGQIAILQDDNTEIYEIKNQAIHCKVTNITVNKDKDFYPNHKDKLNLLPKEDKLQVKNYKRNTVLKYLSIIEISAFSIFCIVFPHLRLLDQKQTFKYLDETLEISNFVTETQLWSDIQLTQSKIDSHLEQLNNVDNNNNEENIDLIINQQLVDITNVTINGHNKIEVAGRYLWDNNLFNYINLIEEVANNIEFEINQEKKSFWIIAYMEGGELY